jgi:hypothetical protein
MTVRCIDGGGVSMSRRRRRLMRRPKSSAAHRGRREPSSGAQAWGAARWEPQLDYGPPRKARMTELPDR